MIPLPKPVLNAVLGDKIAAGKPLDAYADRRRNEERAKQQGGAS